MVFFCTYNVAESNKHYHVTRVLIQQEIYNNDDNDDDGMDKNQIAEKQLLFIINANSQCEGHKVNHTILIIIRIHKC